MSPPSGSPCSYSSKFWGSPSAKDAPFWHPDPARTTILVCRSLHNLRNSSTLFYFLKEYSSHVIYILLPKVEWKDWSLGPVLSENHFPSRMKLLETVEKASIVTFSCYYYIKGEKKKREPKRTIPAFPPDLCFRPLSPLSQGAPLTHQQ